jgi:salicylate hydroxylase
MRRTLRVGLVGGGIGGLACALALTRRGFEAHVFEQAGELREIGAGIGVSPNAVKVLRALGLEDALAARGSQSEAIIGRDWTTARVCFSVPLNGATAARFGAGSFEIHRADLVDILLAASEGTRLNLGSRCVDVDGEPG